MRYTDAPEIASIYIQRIRDFMSGTTSMPEVKYPPRPIGEIHASNVDGLCPLTTYYSWVLPSPPPFSDKTILNFFSGRGFERQIAQEQEPIEVDGILLTIDDDLGKDGITEIKTTRRRMKSFVPDCYPWWNCRAMQYCYARNVTEMNLVVYFIIDSEIRARKLQFTDGEVTRNWEDCLRRAKILKESLQLYADNVNRHPFDISGDPIPAQHVKDNLPPWQCKLCQYKPHCYYYSEEVLPSL